MFDKFGEFDSFEELNKAAEGQKEEGDMEALKELAKENGIDEIDALDYIDGVSGELCTSLTAALGKLQIEEEDMKPSEIVKDWLDYIRSYAMENKHMQRAVRKKGKSMIGCVGAILKWSYTQKYSVDSRIVKASGISASRVEMGIPGMATAKKIIREYYMEG
ncbi:MAG: hypothetical protein IJ600_03395 [Lachnospiraceae bacterium]|nr:hypothetical protein [Lachnospiraceae bacterium]